ncbi:MAG: hypothetical protein QF744_16690, partial [SAR202 cluster bacterium]|nr:hypothetical protein [SAR202 cluster bacterium]
AQRGDPAGRLSYETGASVQIDLTTYSLRDGFTARNSRKYHRLTGSGSGEGMAPDIVPEAVR